jgi:16S rRNA (uracil1498-N3)-methyltransferase
VTPRRAHVPPTVLDELRDGSLTLPRDAAHRFAHVLRLDAGADIELFDGGGRVLRGRFEPPDRARDCELLRVDDVLPPLILAQAVTKTEKLELVVQKATELGASAIVLVDAARCQVRLDADRADKRRARLGRVADDAARQCGRARTPAIEGPEPIDALCARLRAFGGVRAVAALGSSLPLSRLLEEDARLASNGFLVVVGPEGGLTDQEVAALEDAGAQAVRLGAHVLRTETAGLAALAIAQGALGLA